METQALSAAVYTSVALVALFGVLAVVSVLLSAGWVRLPRGALNAVFVAGCVLIVGGVGAVLLLLSIA